MERGARQKGDRGLLSRDHDAGQPAFRTPGRGIATFDQDGTLWVFEHPVYAQLMYCLERVPALVEKKPEWKNVEPWKTVLSGDREAIAKLPMADLEKILAGKPFLNKEPRLLLNDDEAGKPEGIHLMIGRRPVAAFGNSAGDQQMLEYTKAGDGARLAMLVLHADAEREYAYGPRRACPTPSAPSRRRSTTRPRRTVGS